MSFIAYKITHKTSGKAYVGITTRSLKTRWKRHCGDGQRGIGMAIRKYGKAAFTCEHIASSASLPDMLALERILIAQECTLAPRGYNLCGGGEGHFNPSAESRELLRQARKLYTPSPETIEKMRLAGRRRPPPSEESRRKNAEGQRLRKLRGTFTPEVIAKLRAHRHTPETIERMQKAQANRSQEWRDKLSASLTGKRHSEATITKLRERRISEVTRQKISDALTGKKSDARRNQALSAAVKAWWAKRKAAKAAEEGVLL